MMRLLRCEIKKVVPVAGQQHATMLVGKLEGGFVRDVMREGSTQERDIVTELFE